MNASRLRKKLAEAPVGRAEAPSVLSSARPSVYLVFPSVEVQRGMMLLQESGEDRHTEDDAVTWNRWNTQI